MSEIPTQSAAKPKKFFWLKLKERFFDDRKR